MTMQKIEAASPEAQSANLVADNVAQLKALFPELVTEGPNGPAVNLDVLKALVGDATVTDAEEKYGLNWHGKRAARQLALTPSTGTLRPCPDESVDWDTTKNLMIEGDNLEVLKLLQKSYAGKVKLIYIDPPYNTGRDFVYPDDFRDGIANYLEVTGQSEGGKRISSNSEASGRFHTEWLNMMLPRLKLARSLLHSEGVIFVSIGDDEVHHLREVMNEVFGEENFVATVIWEKADSPRNTARQFSEDHDFVLVYSARPEWAPRRLPRTDEANSIYSNPDNDPRGEWIPGDPFANKPYSKGLFSIVGPTGREFSPPPGRYWRVSEEKLRELDADGRVWWGPTKDARPSIKRYLCEVADLTPRTLWRKEDVGSNRTSKNELRALFPDSESFDTPKPTKLIDRMLKLATTGAKPQVLTVNDGDDLQQLAKRAVYADFRVGEINTAKGEEFMELRYPGGEVYLALGQAHGEVDALAVQREMIRRTIKEHLEKEKLLRPKGIKVLSLFFIEAVARYRQYDKDGNPVKGDYARIFEEEYRRAARLPAFQSLFGEVDLAQEAAAVHDGYFSIDKKGRWADPELDKEGGLKNETSRADAERGYNLIMKEKEKLLAFSTPLKFIFSHSALKEGWDNPNVFQICALREMGSERERRQTLGRGLRLCVNQEGQRVYGHDVNRLTVIATESYQEFADQLQKEIEADTGIRFGIVEQDQFATLAITTPDGKVAPLGVDQSKALWDHLRAAGHIDAKGKVQDSLKIALKDGKLVLPEAFEPYRGQVAELLRKVTGRVEVKNRDDRETVPLRKGADGKAVTLSEDFKALWDRIKHKTTYRVQFDNDKLIRDCTAALTRDLHIARARLQWRKADIAIGKSGVEATETAGASTVVLDDADIELPDLLTDLQDRTQLTRRTLVKILTECERLDDFKRNPQQFIEQAAEIINRCKRMALVDGIRYQRLGDDAVWAQELFETEELTGYLTNMLRDTKRSIYEHVVYDSAPERDFADALEKDDDVVLYAKLPGWFKVPTPLGNYNPDWAVLLNKDGTRRLYFVVETKSSLFTDDLRNKESAKIECGKAHFKALRTGENPAQYMVATAWSDVLNRLT